MNGRVWWPGRMTSRVASGGRDALAPFSKHAMFDWVCAMCQAALHACSALHLMSDGHAGVSRQMDLHVTLDIAKPQPHLPPDAHLSQGEP